MFEDFVIPMNMLTSWRNRSVVLGGSLRRTTAVSHWTRLATSSIVPSTLDGRVRQLFRPISRSIPSYQYAQWNSWHGDHEYGNPRESTELCSGLPASFMADTIENRVAGTLWDLFDQSGDPSTIPEAMTHLSRQIW